LVFVVLLCFCFSEFPSHYARSFHLPEYPVQPVEVALAVPVALTPPTPMLVKLVSVQVVVSEKVWVKLKVREHGAVAIEVIVAVLLTPLIVMVVDPPGAVTVVMLPGIVLVEIAPIAVTVVVCTLLGPWIVVVKMEVLVTVCTPPGP